MTIHEIAQTLDAASASVKDALRCLDTVITADWSGVPHPLDEDTLIDLEIVRAYLVDALQRIPDARG